MTSSYLCISFLQQCRRYLFWVVMTHTCARRKTAHVRTAAVVSCPAISIVIKSSRSCPKKLVTGLRLCNKLLTLHEFWSTKNILWIPSCIPLCYWGTSLTCVNKTHIKFGDCDNFLSLYDRKFTEKEHDILPDDHQHQHPSYQLKTAKDLHPANFKSYNTKTHWSEFCNAL